MATIKQLRDSYRKIKVQEQVQQALRVTQRSYIALLKAQLYAGFNVYGRKMGEEPYGAYVLPAYAIEKERMNPLPGLGNPDLFLTGAFYDGIKTYPQEILEIGKDRGGGGEAERGGDHAQQQAFGQHGGVPQIPAHHKLAHEGASITRPHRARPGKPRERCVDESCGQTIRRRCHEVMRQHTVERRV